MKQFTQKLGLANKDLTITPMNKEWKSMKISSREAFDSSREPSLKHSTYFQVYDALFSKYQGKAITFLEIGVLGGGSLFMWRAFLGPSARIIGVDLNPEAKKWEAYGFEIFIGDQADSGFWKNTFNQVGPIHVLLDDGGHSFLQQATSAIEALPFIVDGGMLVVEDTHTSYMQGFGPRKYSFMKLTYAIADQINQRFHGLKSSKLERDINPIWSIEVFESIVCFKIDRTRSGNLSQEVFNRPEDFRQKLPEDFRNHNVNVSIPSGTFFANSLNTIVARLASVLFRMRVQDIKMLRKIFKKSKAPKKI
jgi:hypothetical protein